MFEGEGGLGKEGLENTRVGAARELKQGREESSPLEFRFSNFANWNILVGMTALKTEFVPESTRHSAGTTV